MKKLGTLLFTMGGASLLFACGGDGADLAEDSTANSSGGSAPTAGGSAGVGGDGSGGMAPGGGSGSGGMVGTVGGANSGGLSGAGGASGAGGNGPASGGNGAGGEFVGSGGQEGIGGSPNADCTDVGAADNFSFFVTSWDGIRELAQSNDGFGGDLRYPAGETDGLQGADNICQELASRVCHGHKTWKAYLSTSQVDAIDHIEGGPWFDFTGTQVAATKSDLIGEGTASSGSCGNIDYAAGDRLEGGAGPCGTYDELGNIHDGTTDINGDGTPADDDHDTMTATLANGSYAGFSCEDWTSTTATSGDDGGSGGGMFGGFNSGIQMGHSWPARSGLGWSQAHAGHQCAAGTNFIQDGAGDGATVGGGGGYGGFYCFAVTSE